MPALQVRDFPDDIYEELRRCAEEDRRSIAQQTIVAVEDYLERRKRLRVIEQDGDAAATAGCTHPLAAPAAAGAANGYVTPGRPPTDREAIRARRRTVLDNIKRVPLFDLPEGYENEADIIREMREERDEHLFRLAGGYE